MTRHKHKHEKPDDVAPPAAAQPSAPADGTTEAPAAEAPAPSPTPSLEQELAAAKDRHVRLLADFENFRRRTIRERSEAASRACEALLADLLPVIDHFELALKQAGANPDPFTSGVRLVYDQLFDVLRKAGLAPVDARATFDPACHEAIAYLASDDKRDGEVIEQIRCGYRLGERVLRPAAVIVSSGPPPRDETAAADEPASPTPPSHDPLPDRPA